MKTKAPPFFFTASPSGRILRLSLFGCAVLSFTGQLHAASYQFIGTNDTPWDNQTTARWNQLSPWSGTPGASGPTSSDDLDLASANYFNVRPTGTTPTVVTIANYSIHNLSASVADAKLSAFNFYDSTLTIQNNLNLSVVGASLSVSNRNSTSSSLTVQVNGNVNVGAGTTLSLGIPTSDSSSSLLKSFTVAGTTTINGSVLVHRQNTSDSANFGDLSMGSGGALILSAYQTVNNASPIDRTINARSLTGAGTISGGNAAGWSGVRNSTLHLTTGALTDSTFSGVLQDSSVTVTSGTNKLHLTVSGSGVQKLTGINTYSGVTTINGGTLIISGSGSINNTSAITLSSGKLIQESSVALTKAITWTGGTVSGSGTITGNLIASGAGEKTLSPGNSPGVLSVSGNVTLDSNTAFKIELNGLTRGLQYDALDVGGQFTLGGSTLNVTFGYSAEVGDQFTIASFNSRNGTFAGLNNGDLFNVGINTLRISYNTDNIILSVTAVPEPGAVLLCLIPGALFLVYRKRFTRHT